jgi:hypothetical protein
MNPSLRDQLAPIRAQLAPERPWCHGKVRHPSMGAAEAHARSLRRRFDAHVGAYRCVTCLGFHVGRIRENRT